jgi:hypothetical protein
VSLCNGVRRAGSPPGTGEPPSTCEKPVPHWDSNPDWADFKNNRAWRETSGELACLAWRKANGSSAGPCVQVRARLRTIDFPTVDPYEAPIQMPVTGYAWDAEDHSAARNCTAATSCPAPGRMSPGASASSSRSVTATGFPYKAMQFKATLKDTLS